MQRFFKIISIVGICLWAGCVPDRGKPIQTKDVYTDISSVDIKVITIDNHEYILARYSGHGIAICPKTPNSQ